MSPCYSKHKSNFNENYTHTEADANMSKFDDDDDWLFHILYKESENKSVVF